ncbi:hypothetical protein VNI00_007889 [Paramarasmius palmivorus]|uniref:Uncharacterized protein n=1 Tax=Paramarasmius palmivorus TaxID=297713 RepID=A0AAW0CVH3_9AGAR
MFVFSLLFLSRLVLGKLVTRYIDDFYGDSLTRERPEFYGDSPGGALQPDPNLAFNGTWHDNTRHTGEQLRGVRFNFFGSSIEVFCILSNSPPTQVTATYNLSFLIDGQPAGPSFVHSPDQTNDFSYNQSVFSINDIPNTSHTMELRMESNSTDAILLFDYAKYQFDDGISESSSIAPTATSTGTPDANNDSSDRRLAIILGVVLGTLVFAITGALLFWLRRRPRQRNQPPPESLSTSPSSSPEPQYIIPAAPSKDPHRLQLWTPPPNSSSDYPTTITSTDSSYRDDDGTMTTTSYLMSQTGTTTLTLPPAYHTLSRRGTERVTV